MEQRRLNPDTGRRSIPPPEIEDLSIGAGFKKRVWTQLLSSAALVGSRGTNQHHKVKLMAVVQMMTEFSLNIRKAKGGRRLRVLGELLDEPVEIALSGRNKPGGTFRSSDRALAGPRQSRSADVAAMEHFLAASLAGLNIQHAGQPDTI